MQGEANSVIAEERISDSLFIIVPRTGVDRYRSLNNSFGDGAQTRVILDRRYAERRVRAEANGPERRRADRRRRADAQAALRAGRWVAVARPRKPVDFHDLDNRAILFLCCSEHLVPCEGCQDAYRIGWISRGATGAFPCPRCGSDLTPVIVAHTDLCRYWAGRRAEVVPRERTASTT